MRNKFNRRAVKNINNQSFLSKLYRIMVASNDKVAIVNETVGISAKTTLEDILFFNFNSFWTFGDFMTDLGAVVANIVSWLMLEKIFV